MKKVTYTAAYYIYAGIVLPLFWIVLILNLVPALFLGRKYHWPEFKVSQVVYMYPHILQTVGLAALFVKGYELSGLYRVEEFLRRNKA